MKNCSEQLAEHTSLSDQHYRGQACNGHFLLGSTVRADIPQAHCGRKFTIKTVSATGLPDVAMETSKPILCVKKDFQLQYSWDIEKKKKKKTCSAFNEQNLKNLTDRICLQGFHAFLRCLEKQMPLQV